MAAPPQVDAIPSYLRGIRAVKRAEALSDAQSPVDAIHVEPRKGRSWIAHLWPDSESLHNVCRH